MLIAYRGEASGFSDGYWLKNLFNMNVIIVLNLKKYMHIDYCQLLNILKEDKLKREI
jgi:hypothetical protein